MKKVNNVKVGSYIVWSDYIKSRKDKETDEVTYQSSPVPLPGYSERYIGLCLLKDNYGYDSGEVYIAVSVNRSLGSKKQSTNPNWWKFIIDNRLQRLFDNNGNMEPGDKGMTRVPVAYLDILSDDPIAYTNIYGSIPLSELEKAVTALGGYVRGSTKAS